MTGHADKTHEPQSLSLANQDAQKQSDGQAAFQFLDNRPEAAAQRKLQAMLNNNAPAKQGSYEQPVQRMENGNAKAGVVQRVGFLPGQDQLVMDWLVETGIDDWPIFAGLWNRFTTDGGLGNDDAEGIGLLFLTKEAIYRDFPYRDLALAFIAGDCYGFGIPRAIASVSDFTNAYKTFFHLFMRAVNGGCDEPTAVEHVYNGIAGLDEALGGADTGQPSFETDETGNPEVHVGMIQNFAENSQLNFSSTSSGISHLLKHGTLFNNGYKITGYEGVGNLQTAYNFYLMRANEVVANGVSAPLGYTLGNPVYSFTYQGDRAIVSFDEQTSTATLTTYFPDEPIDTVNENV